MIAVGPTSGPGGRAEPARPPADYLTGGPPTGVEIVHHLPGRVRFRVAAMRRDRLRGARAADEAQKLPGVTSARAAAACDSLVVTYDPGATNAGTIAAALSQERLRPLRARVAAEPPGGATLWWSVAALGLSALGAPPALAAGAICVSAVPIVARAAQSLRAERKVGVDVLDATAIGLLSLRGNLVTASLTSCLIATGEYIRSLTARRSRRALHALWSSTAPSAWVVSGRQRERRPADGVREGEVVVVYAGELVPVDGIVVRGGALVDQRVLTGESVPVLRQVNDSVLASTHVTDGKIYIRTLRAGAGTRAQRIVQMLEGAPLHDTRVANYAGQVADRLVLPTLGFAAGTLLVTGNPSRAVSILVFEFATGIRVSAPTTILAAMSTAVRRGILVKGGRALEQLSNVDTLVFDKTGTLTRGEPRVTSVVPSPGVARDLVLTLAASAERRLSHPAATAIVRSARARGLDVPERSDSRYVIGQGVEASVEGSRVLVGSAGFLREQGVPVNAELAAKADDAAEHGSTSVFVARDGEPLGFVAYADVARPEAAAVVRALRDRGVRHLVMVTGDNPRVANVVARQVGIDRVEAGVFPEGKAVLVRTLQRQGHVVGVVGDGINDSPALSFADVSFSLRAGSDAARETADIVLHGDLTGLPEALDLARETMGLVRQNLTLVVVPNVAGMVLAGLGLLNPIAATAINNGSAVLAAVNGLRPLLSRPESLGREPVRAQRPIALARGTAASTGAPRREATSA